MPSSSRPARGAPERRLATTLVLLGFAVTLAGGVYALDSLSNSHVAGAALYCLVIFYCWLFEGSAPVVWVAGACTVLALLDVFTSHSPSDDVAGINKVISIGVIWVSAALVLFVKSSVKQTEESRQRLALEAAKFESALENAPNAVLLVDRAGRIVLANAQAEKLFGYSRRELTRVDLLVPDWAREGHGAVRDLTVRRKDGTEVDVEIGLNPVTTPEGTLVIASVVDITARKLAAKLMEERHRIEAERFTQELQLAAKIQTSILPRPPFVPGVDIAAKMIPAASVGGDYYDVFPAADGCWLAIGDVSGHGLDAGLVSLMVQSATSAILHSMPDVPPARALEGINATLENNIRHRLERRDYVTFNILRYRKDGSVVHCGAHQDILVFRAKSRTVESHSTQGTWLALQEHGRYEARELRLQPGDAMVLFTDGLVEARNDAGEMLGIERVRTAILERGDSPAAALVDALVEQTLTWTHQVEDDVTVVVLRHEEPTAGER
jgi:serine phosphatase RsbU (regulator of sigma subunit)